MFPEIRARTCGNKFEKNENAGISWFAQKEMCCPTI